MFTADHVVDDFTKVVESLADGDIEAARDAVLCLDIDAIADVRSARQKDAISVAPVGPVVLPAKPRVATGLQKFAVFARDAWTCRFCGTRTIDLRVLRRVSEVLPEVFPFHSNWKFGHSHLMFWTHSSSLEHVVPFSRGGADDESNFVCTCYACNDARKHLLLEEIGWNLQPLAEPGWDGLTQYIGRF